MLGSSLTLYEGAIVLLVYIADETLHFLSSRIHDRVGIHCSVILITVILIVL